MTLASMPEPLSKWPSGQPTAGWRRFAKFGLFTAHFFPALSLSSSHSLTPTLPLASLTQL
jgi:hypothetical protein